MPNEAQAKSDRPAPGTSPPVPEMGVTAEGGTKSIKIGDRGPSTTMGVGERMGFVDEVGGTRSEAVF